MSSLTRYGVPRPPSEPPRRHSRSYTPATSTTPTDQDLPPVPFVVHAVEVISRPQVYVGRSPVTQVVAPADAPPKPVIVGSQLEPFYRQQPQILVGRPADVSATPPKPLIVGSQPESFYRQQPQVYLKRQPLSQAAVATDTPAKIVVVTAQPLPQQPAYKFISAPLLREITDDIPPVPMVHVGAGAAGGASAFVHKIPTPPPPPGIPPRPAVVSLPWHNSQAGGQVWVSSLIPETPPPTVPTEQPALARIISSTPVPPTVQTPFVSRTPAAPAAPPPAVPVKPITIAAQPLPAQTAAPFQYQPRVPFVAPPSVQAKPLVLSAPWYPASGGGQVWVSSLIPEAAPAATPTEQPATPRIITATPLPPTVPKPYVSWAAVAPTAAPAGLPAKPLVVVSQQIPWQERTGRAYIPRRHEYAELDTLPPVPTISVGAGIAADGFALVLRQPVDPTAPPPAVPIQPTVVRAQQLPPQTQAPFAYYTRVAPPPAPQTPPKPTIIKAQEPPTPKAYQATNWTAVPADTPTASIVVRAQEPPIPQPYTFVKVTKVQPPPILRRPATPIVFDVSRPPLPHGSAIIRKGFKEADAVVPIIYEPWLYVQPNGADLYVQPNGADLYVEPSEAALNVGA